MLLSIRKQPIAYFLSITILSSTLMFSCGKASETSGKEAEEDSSYFPELLVEEEKEEIPDSTEIYYSADLKSFGIKGEVLERSAMRHDAQIVYPIPTNRLTFDENGVFTGSLEGLYPKKDENGINNFYSMNYEDGTSWELSYTDFNEEGYPVRAEIVESGPQGTAQAVITYFGYEYDSARNWVMRSVSCERSFTDIDTQEKTNTFRKWKELVSYKYKPSEEKQAE